MKKKLVKSLALAFLGSLLMAGSASALPTLNDVFQDVGSSNREGVNETGSEIYTVTSPISSAWEMYYTATSHVTEFGLYNANVAPASLTADDKLVLFSNSGAIPLTGLSTVVFDGFGTMMSSFGAGNDTAAYMSSFGFYAYDGTNYRYSVAASNAGGADYYETYRGISGDSIDAADGIAGANNPNSTNYLDDPQHWWIALMNGPTTSTSPLVPDLVVRTESMQPVPEPATMLLLGTGLVGLAGARRRKNTKA